MSQLIAVLTGDIIASRKIADTDHLFGILDGTLEMLAGRFGGQGERYRGDGFQLALPHAEHAMTAAVMLRAALIMHSDAQRWDARIAVAIGQYDWQPDLRVTHADGEPFIRSGQALDALAANSDHLSLDMADSDDSACLVLLTRFADELIEGWSRYSAEAVSLLLQYGGPQQALGKRLGISQPGVHKRLRTARWTLLDAYLAHMRQHFTQVGAT